MNISKETKEALIQFNDWMERVRLPISVFWSNSDIALYAEYERLKTSVSSWREPSYNVIEFQGMLELNMTWEFGSKKLDVILFHVPGAAVDVTYELKQDEVMLSKGLLADSFPTYWKWLWEVGEG